MPTERAPPPLRLQNEVTEKLLSDLRVVHRFFSSYETMHDVESLSSLKAVTKLRTPVKYSKSVEESLNFESSQARRDFKCF